MKLDYFMIMGTSVFSKYVAFALFRVDIYLLIQFNFRWISSYEFPAYLPNYFFSILIQQAFLFHSPMNLNKGADLNLNKTIFREWLQHIFQNI